MSQMQKSNQLANLVVKGIASIVLIVCLLAGVAYAAQQIPIIVDGKDSGNRAVMIKEEVYIPISVARFLQGKTINYDSSSQVVNIASANIQTQKVKPVLHVVVGHSIVQSIIEDLGLPYRKATTLPDKLEFYSCIVFENQNAATAKASQKLRQYITNGGGLVIWGDMPIKLASTNEHVVLGGWSLRPIADWFGAASMWNIHHELADAIVTTANHPLNTKIENGAVLMKYQGEPKYFMLENTDEFCENYTEWVRTSDRGVVTFDNSEHHFIAAMAHPYGKGCIYWQSVISDPNYPALAELFRAGIARVTPGAQYTPVRVKTSGTVKSPSAGDAAKTDSLRKGLETLKNKWGF